MITDMGSAEALAEPVAISPRAALPTSNEIPKLARHKRRDCSFSGAFR
jgi:hypothetical protein